MEFPANGLESRIFITVGQSEAATCGKTQTKTLPERQDIAYFVPPFRRKLWGYFLPQVAASL
jgi:hypothetical protein